MEKNEKNSKQKFIIIGVIAIIVVIMVAVPIIEKQVRMNNAQKKIDSIRDTISGGISSDGSTSTNQEIIKYINDSLTHIIILKCGDLQI